MLEQCAPGPGYQLHHGFVGLHLRQHIADGDGLAFLLLPFDEATLLHGGRERFHYDFRRHA
jgi:hypothetical protein